MNLFKRGAVYWYDFRVGGRRYRGSTRCRTRTAAQEAAQAALRAACTTPVGEGWRLEKAVQRTARARWQGTKGEGTALANARVALDYFGDVPVSAITTARLDEYVEHLRLLGNADGTVNRKLAALSAVLRTAQQRGQLAAMPTVPRLREASGRIRWLTDDEEARLLAQMGAQWVAHRRLTVFLLDTGLRLGEALRVNPSRDVTGAGVHIWETKGDKPRTVPLTDRARWAVRAARPHYPEFMCRARPNLWGLTKGQFYHAFKSACKAAGLTDVSPHTLRHTCASRLVQRGVPLKVVQEWLGHRNITTTMRYAHLNADNLRAAVAVLEQRPTPTPPTLRAVK